MFEISQLESVISILIKITQEMWLHKFLHAFSSWQSVPNESLGTIKEVISSVQTYNFTA